MYYIEMVLEIVLDVLEDLFNLLFIPVGKQLNELLVYSLINLLLSILLGIYNRLCFISWKESLLTTIIIAVLILCSYKGRFSVLKNKVLKLKGALSKHEK